MKNTLLFVITLLLINGCTQLITAPISVAGAVAGTAIDVTSATVHAVTDSGDDD